MPRHWRCANGHAWTGDLGALTYCPDCGSADVYEVRPQWPPADRRPAPPDTDDAANRTMVQPAAGPQAAPPTEVSDTLIQPIPAPADASTIGDTLVQAP